MPRMSSARSRMPTSPEGSAAATNSDPTRLDRKGLDASEEALEDAPGERPCVEETADPPAMGRVRLALTPTRPTDFLAFRPRSDHGLARRDVRRRPWQAGSARHRHRDVRRQAGQCVEFLHGFRFADREHQREPFRSKATADEHKHLNRCADPRLRVVCGARAFRSRTYHATARRARQGPPGAVRRRPLLQAEGDSRRRAAGREGAQNVRRRRGRCCRPASVSSASYSTPVTRANWRPVLPCSAR